MERIASINAYSTDGKKYVIITTPDGNVYSCNYGLVKYALEHVTETKKKNKK